MLEALFGGRTVEQILLYLFVNVQAYPSELAKRWEQPVSTIQGAFDRLESGGILASRLVGRTRVYQFDPRYYFLEELKQLLSRAYEALPEEIKEKMYEPQGRKKPRKRGKP